MHRRNFELVEGMPASTGMTTDVESDKGYKYFGIPQANENMQDKIKSETKKVCMKRMKQALKSKLNGRNNI